MEFTDEVQAEIVDIAPHLAMVGTFAVHKHRTWDDCWSVSNVETGRSIHGRGAEHWGSRREAILECALILAEKTEADILKAYRRLPQSLK